MVVTVCSYRLGCGLGEEESVGYDDALLIKYGLGHKLVRRQWRKWLDVKIVVVPDLMLFLSRKELFCTDLSFDVSSWHTLIIL
ncbi:hypothetical protein DSUL_140084 [Desulfovibrionales bacterium]